ncbi:hypothetical protein M407DRAFT_18443 [Tulasnella calospora MUT 4182]|uniref:Uncharacterized protein n=1 Tax=Tulasnella calospora MUT 4182 TaxID=1051891 RepID=A0A0C3QJX3_9AGAM|nr:hypothetical protein M407DRAFT_18443 [Tulasnella calospora MUT 4182]
MSFSWMKSAIYQAAAAFHGFVEPLQWPKVSATTLRRNEPSKCNRSIGWFEVMICGRNLLREYA